MLFSLLPLSQCLSSVSFLQFCHTLPNWHLPAFRSEEANILFWSQSWRTMSLTSLKTTILYSSVLWATFNKANSAFSLISHHPHLTPVTIFVYFLCFPNCFFWADHLEEPPLSSVFCSDPSVWASVSFSFFPLQYLHQWFIPQILF